MSLAVEYSSLGYSVYYTSRCFICPLKLFAFDSAVPCHTEVARILQTHDINMYNSERHWQTLFERKIIKQNEV